MSLKSFLRKSRIAFNSADKTKQIRAVYVSEAASSDAEKNQLSKYIADKAPLYYRNLEDIIKSLKDGFFTTTIYETLQKLPTSEHFQSSHFGEIVSSIFLEDILNLKRLYSKLALNTTENQNAYKMDIICYDPSSDPIKFVFCEVKSSPKSKEDGLPAGHDKSCYADIFNSLRTYSESDKKFDLTAIKDKLNGVEEEERKRIKSALMPYQQIVVGYIGVSVIDHNTYDESEVEILAKRKSVKDFNAEIICVESYKTVSLEVFKRLEELKNNTI